MVLASQGSCASSCRSLHTSSPSSVLWTQTRTQTQAELCVSSPLQHISSCLSQLKSQDSLSAPPEVRKGAAGAAPAWTGGGSLRPCKQISCTSCLGCWHLQGVWITPQKSSQTGKVCVSLITAAAWPPSLAACTGHTSARVWHCRTQGDHAPRGQAGISALKSPQHNFSCWNTPRECRANAHPHGEG